MPELPPRIPRKGSSRSGRQSQAKRKSGPSPLILVLGIGGALGLVLLIGVGFLVVRAMSSPAAGPQENAPDAAATIGQAGASPTPSVAASAPPVTPPVANATQSQQPVDFVAEMNKVAAHNATADQNAVVLLAQVFGTLAVDAPSHERFAALLGATDVPLTRDTPILRVDASGNAAGGTAESQFLQQVEIVRRDVAQANKHAAVNEWIAACKADLDLCVTAAQRPVSYHPYVAPPVADPSSSTAPLTRVGLDLVGQCRALAKALGARASIRASSGDVDGALTDMLAIWRLGRLISQGPLTIQLLVGIAVEVTAFETTTAVLNSGALKDEHLSHLEHELQALPPRGTLHDAVHVGDRAMALDALAAASQYGLGVLKATYELEREIPESTAALNATDWGAARQQVNTWFDRYAAATARTSCRERVTELEQLAKAASDAVVPPSAPRSGNEMGARIGSMVASFNSPAPVTPFAEVHGQTRYEQALLAIRLLRHHLAHGLFPDSVSDLDASNLPLLDRYTGESVVYRHSTKDAHVYSRGNNFRDDGGPTVPSTPQQDDVGFTLIVP